MRDSKQPATGFTGTRIRNILIAVLLPLAIVGAYFGALGGSADRDDALPVVLVNNDEMVEQANADGTTTQVVAGRLLVTWLTDPENAGRYDWELVNAETAQQRIDSGTAYAAVEIPENLSASVVSMGGGDPQQARVNITVSQATDWMTGEVTQQIFTGMTAQFGQQITNQVAVGLADGLNESADGLQDAADGAQDLADGAGELGDGFSTYQDGAQDLADATGEAADGAGTLSDGAGQLSSGVEQYVGGVDSYVDGVDQYVDGADQLASGVGDYAGGVDSYADGVEQYVGGVQQLADGLGELDGGSAALQEAAGQLGEIAEALNSNSTTIDDAVAGLEQLRTVVSSLDGIDPSQLQTYCDLLTDVDPAQAEACTTALSELAGQIPDTGTDVTEIETQLDELIGQIEDVEGAGDQLSQLASGLTDYTNGVSQLASGAGELDGAGDELVSGGGELATAGGELASGAEQLESASTQISDGGDQLVSAGGDLTDGVGDLADGAGELASGLDQLQEGQQQLVDGGDQLGDGIDGIEDGAGTMAEALQEGADQAKNAIGDPETFADTVAEPVVAEVSAVHDPTFAGVLAALLLPLGIWLAGLIAALRRGVVTDELLDSSASTWSILLGATRKLGAPIVAVAGITTLAQHVFFGVPWAGIGVTLLFAVLASACTIALHLMFSAFAKRRTAAIVSIVVLALQLVLVRGFLPLELRAGWAQTLSGFAPMSQVASGMQAGYAGASAGAVVGPVLILALMTVAAAGVAAIAMATRRHSKAKSLIAATSGAA
jgi:putative membrane protein